MTHCRHDRGHGSAASTTAVTDMHERVVNGTSTANDSTPLLWPSGDDTLSDDHRTGATGSLAHRSDRPQNATPDTTHAMFVLVCGLPGAGKTTVAGEVVDRLGAVRIRTDVVRKDLFDAPEYSDAETDTVYRTVVERADAVLDDGQHVVLDGTFRERGFREPAYAVARDHDVEMVVLKVEADDDVVKERIRKREDDASDADVSIYEHYRDKFDPIQVDHVVVDNSGSLDATREQVRRSIDRAQATDPTVG